MLKVALPARYLAAVAGFACMSAAQAQVGADATHEQRQPGPQQDAGPLQGAGPLHGAGPLQSAAPLQNIAPGGLPTDLGNLQPRHADGPPLMPTPVASAVEPMVALPTDVGTMNELVAKMLAGANGTNPAVLASMIKLLTSQQPSASTVTSSSPPSILPPAFTPPPVFAAVTAPVPPTPPTPSAPTPLPPVFNVPPQAQASPR
jgi:hypothetical protein